MTAVIRRAEARRSASRRMNSSIRLSLTGWHVGWITNTSWPRIESWILTSISPSGNRRTRGSVSGTPISSEISAPSSGLELPATSLSWPHGRSASLANSRVGSGLPITSVPPPPFPLSRIRARPVFGAGGRRGWLTAPYRPRRHADCGRTWRHVPRHHRARSRPGPSPDPDRRPEHRVHADECAIFDHGRVLPNPIVVGGDGTRSDIHVLTHCRVAQVRDVGHPAAPTDARSHQLGEAANVDTLGHPRTRPQLGERPSVGAGSELGAVEPRMLDAHAVTDRRVSDLGKGTDVTVLADHRVPTQDREGLQDRVHADPDTYFYIRRGGIDHRDAEVHQVRQQPLPQGPLGVRELDAVVDPDRLAPVTDSQDLDGTKVAKHVREVEFPRLVVRPEPIQCLQKPFAVETVEPDIDLRKSTCVLSGIPELHDPVQHPVLSTDETSVAPRRVLHAGQRRRQPSRTMVDKQPADGFAADERQITIQNEDVAPRQPVCRNLGHRMAGPERLVLQDDFAAVLEVLCDRLLAGRDDHSYV